MRNILYAVAAVLLLVTPATAAATYYDVEEPTIVEEEEVEEARSDLARRLGVDPDRIEVVEAKAVMWSDGSLGCPRPDMAYTQALVKGVLIRLAYEGREYAYHAGDGQRMFLCE